MPTSSARSGRKALRRPGYGDLALGCLEVRILAGRARDADAGHARGNGEIHEPIEGLEVDPAVVMSRCHERREQAREPIPLRR